EQRAFYLPVPSIKANGLSNSQNVVLIKSPVERRAAVSRSAECNSLFGYVGVRRFVIISGDQPGNVDQLRSCCRLSCERIYIFGIYNADGSDTSSKRFRSIARDGGCMAPL